MDEPGARHAAFYQVKRVYTKRGKPTINLVKSGDEKYDEEDADYFLGVDVGTSRIWKIPLDEVTRAGQHPGATEPEEQ